MQESEFPACTVVSEHSHDIMLKLDNDRKDLAEYCDITFIVNECRYPAHKCVFGLLSRFMNKMFNIDMKEKRDGEAVIRGVSNEVFEAILDLVYTGRITLSMENVFEIMKAAHYMDLPFVKECCTKYLGDKVKVDNWLSIRAYGKLYDYKELLEKVDESLSKQFRTVIDSVSFPTLEINDVKHLFGLKRKTPYSEEKLYRAIINWIKRDLNDRGKHAEDLLKFVKFSKTSLNFLDETVVREELVVKSHAIIQDVREIIKDWYPFALQPSRGAEQAWPIKDFVAVDRRTVYKVTKGGLQKQMLRFDHDGGSAVQLNAEVLIIGGKETKEMECVNKYELKTSLRCCYSTVYRRYHAAAVMIADILYVVGGLPSEASAEFRTFCEGCPWNLHRFINFNRHGHSLVSLDGMIYVLGGKPNYSFVCFDPRSNRTTVLGEMTYRRIHMAAVVLKNEIYAIGGTFSTLYKCWDPCPSVEKYDILNRSWGLVAAMNIPRQRPAACVLNDLIVVVGGGSNVVEVYNPKSRRWTMVAQVDGLENVFSIFPVE